MILTAANAVSGGTLTPLQVALTAGISGAVIEGGGEFIDELHEGEPINWGAVAARTVGGGAKGAMFSVPGLGIAKLAAGTVGIATAENYLHSAAKGDVSAEALGKALADGTIEGVTAGLVDVAAKKVLGSQPHAEPKPKPDLQMQPMTESELEGAAGGATDLSWNPNIGNNCSNDVIQYEKLKSKYAADEIYQADRIGMSALKDDVSHRAASYLSKEQLANGKTYTLTGGDNKPYRLLQVRGQLNGSDGIFEYITNEAGQVTHQRFIKGGVYTGTPNQKVTEG